jgi:hypothetical protein
MIERLARSLGGRALTIRGSTLGEQPHERGCLLARGQRRAGHLHHAAEALGGRCGRAQREVPAEGRRHDVRPIDPEPVEHVSRRTWLRSGQVAGGDRVRGAQPGAWTVDEQAAQPVDVGHQRRPRRAGVRAAVDEQDRLALADLLHAHIVPVEASRTWCSVGARPTEAQKRGLGLAVGGASADNELTAMRSWPGRRRSSGRCRVPGRLDADRGRTGQLACTSVPSMTRV